MTWGYHIKGINAKGREKWLGSVQMHLIKEEITTSKKKKMKVWGEGLLSSECDTLYNSHQQNA